MDSDLNAWLQLIIRWVHVFASILWVGTTYFFTWLDGRFTELEKNKEPGKRHVWMVHSGGFYLVEKQQNPQLMPQKLHWFRWEAAITWLSGIFLLVLVYYTGGLMIDLEDSPISKSTAIMLSVAFLIVGWLVYDLVWSSRLFRDERIGVTISFVLVVMLTYVLCRLFSGRAAYMQMGAVFGTIMTANVWMRILPPQRRMVSALKEGRQPDLAEGLRAKTRSKHNTFLVVPLVFIMISSHFPVATYGHRYNWVILSVLVLAGWGAAKVIRRA